MSNLNEYANQRDDLLKSIVDYLKHDDRFVAAWLTGSFGRGEAQADSDLDLMVATTDEALLTRPSLPPHQVPPARLALIRQFGEPGLIFEAHHNAPAGSTMTTVYYGTTAVCVDWVLRPLTGTTRPLLSLLLFEKSAIPIQPAVEAESEAERIRLAEHDIAYFWLMTAVIPKYIIRGETLLFHIWLKTLHDVQHNLERLIAGQPKQYRPDIGVPLKLSQAEQITAVLDLCTGVEELMTAVAKMGGSVPEDPMSIVRRRLALTE